MFFGVFITFGKNHGYMFEYVFCIKHGYFVVTMVLLKYYIAILFFG